MKNARHIAIGTALFAASGGFGCGGEDGSGPLGNVDSLVILQRPIRNDSGDIFQYTSYVPGARLVKLSPPTADGTLETLFPSAALLAGPDAAMYQDVDVSGYDISFDAKQIVFSARTSMTTNYGLYILTLADGSVDAVPVDPGRDYTNPMWLPGEKIMFTSNSVDLDAPNEGAMTKQHVDEYERGVTLQVGRINIDGTQEELGPRNLSHRNFPSLVSDGSIIMTQWDHLGPVNAGHLVFMKQDMTETREGFGKEGTGAANSTLKAREISAGRFLAIATSRDRTIQAGKLIDIRLGTVVDDDGVISAGAKQTEARATYVDLSPDVPADREPSADTVGRYYDAFPLNAKNRPDVLVSWADGPVESEVLGAANKSANFGIYLLDTARGQRRPILDDPTMWDLFARPLATRSAPPIVGSAVDPNLNGAAQIGSLNAYDTTIATFQPGQIFGVRVLEGFSSEEGFSEMFGTTMFEGQAELGIAPLASDGSWLAKVPANVPLHVQAIDKFGLSLQNEPVWFSARPGESRMCGGCHEDRALTTNVQPGQLEAFAIGAVDMKSGVARADRKRIAPLTRDGIMGVPWGPDPGGAGPAVANTIQAIFNAKCLECHDNRNVAGIEGYTISDPTGMTPPATFTFNLEATLISMNVGGIDLGTWPASYISMAGPDMEAIQEANLTVMGNFKIYMNPQDARGSIAIQKLSPPIQFPTQSFAERAFGPGHMTEVGRPGLELTADEFYALILAADAGVNFFSRENNPGLAQY